MKAMTLRLKSPAKINLFLNVLKKRKDGFHEIETLFERISVCDEIILRPVKSGIHVESDSREIPKGPRNLAWRAAKLLKDTFHIREGVHITIHKKIPVSAGLGGGSSNAATVLLGLNKLWKLGLSKKELVKLGARLGSDVPFFISETSFCLGYGRGEILTKINTRGVKFWHVVVKPPFGISTKEAYKAFSKLGLTLPWADVKILVRSLRKGQAGVVSKGLLNSLDAGIGQITAIKQALLAQGALGALMSGSGSAVFGIYKNCKAALMAARGLRRNRGWQVFVASTF